MTRGAAVAFLAVLSACSRSPTPLSVHNTVPDFSLTDQTGATFDSAARLKGKVWIADFIFTTCTGPCPRLSSQMKQVQAALSSEPEVRAVSFTVDPVNDTPSALAAYAKRYEANPDRWFFLTGDTQTLHHLNREVFLLGSVDGKNTDHSTRFVLVDRQGRVRNYYDTTEASAIPALIADARRLLAESS